MPQQSWSNKRERQYEHIKESARSRGASKDRAKEIAARTVNKQRQEAGETKRKTRRPGGSGNPNRPLEDRRKNELYNRARQLHIEGRSKMNKDELVRAIRSASAS